MADKIIIDFENNTIEFDTPGQKGTERFPGIKDKKEEILKVLGYETVDWSILNKVDARFVPALLALQESGKIELEELSGIDPELIEAFLLELLNK